MCSLELSLENQTQDMAKVVSVIAERYVAIRI